MVDVASPFVFQEPASSSLSRFEVSNIGPTWHATGMANRQQQTPSRAAPHSQMQTSRRLSGQNAVQAPHTAQGLVATIQETSTYAAAPSYQTAGINNWVPEVANNIQNQQRVASSYDSSYANAAWQNPSLTVVNQASSSQSLPPRDDIRLPHTPTIHIFDDSSNLTDPQRQAILRQRAYPNNYHPGYLDPSSYNMAAAYEQAQTTEMPSPVSPQSGRNSRAVTPMGEPVARKRAYSEISQQAPVMLHHNVLQAEPQSAIILEGPRLTQRISRTVKRTAAPMNEERKYVCDASPDCANLVFERKCEWSKHMDKHDRPYRCPHPQCAKLQGFTYSGGLLRHEREVHNKHGGPKAFLMCPHANCKRHTEKGFTRKENLQEHLRRVHSGKEESLNIDSAELETPASGLSGGMSGDEMYAAASSSKRQRSYDPELDNTARIRVDELEQQLSILTHENEQKTQLIERLQVEAQAQNARLATLENTIQQLQSPSS